MPVYTSLLPISWQLHTGRITSVSSTVQADKAMRHVFSMAIQVMFFASYNMITHPALQAMTCMIVHPAEQGQ